jgi:predicted nucleotidyltransferase
MVSMAQIQELADRIAMAFRPERIVLFGSYSSGSPTTDSDVDLMVIAEHTGRNREYATRIRNRLHPSFPLDLLVRTPAELRERLAWRDPFFREITERGKVLYEADHARMDREGRS